MKKRIKKIIIASIFGIIGVTLSFNVYAHSGRTDSSGGHKDKQNKSGLGSYHYHCGGYPAHLHPNGICPYSSDYSTQDYSEDKEDNEIEISKIEINDSDTELEIGETISLSANIKPSNVTDKTVTWKSSNKKIATVSEKGKVTAISKGTVTITVTTSNGKKDSIELIIREKEKENEDKDIESNSMINKTFSIQNEINKNQKEEEETAGGIGGTLLGVAGTIGLGCVVYKKLKK